MHVLRNSFGIFREICASLLQEAKLAKCPLAVALPHLASSSDLAKADAAAVAHLCGSTGSSSSSSAANAFSAAPETSGAVAASTEVAASATNCDGGAAASSTATSSALVSGVAIVQCEDAEDANLGSWREQVRSFEKYPKTLADILRLAQAKVFLNIII